MKIINKTSLGVMFICLSLGLSAKKEQYQPDQLKPILESPRIIAALETLKQATNNHQKNQLVMSWKNDGALLGIEKDKLLFEATINFRQDKASASNVDLMESLLSYEAQSQTFMSDGGYQIPINIFEVAASAKATLLHWEIEQSFSESKQLLNQSGELFLNQLNTGSNKQSHVKGYIKTLQQASEAKLNEVVSLVNKNDHSLPVAALNELARLSQNKQLYHKLFSNHSLSKFEQSRVLQNLKSLPHNLEMSDKVALLTGAVSNPKLKDAALLSLADYQDTSNTARELLFSQLADKRFGGTAAKALSKSEDLLTLEILKQNVMGKKDLTARRSLLALYLNRSPEAMDILREFQDSTIDANLKKEVAQWIR